MQVLDAFSTEISFISKTFLFLLQPFHWWYKLFLAHGVVCGMDYLHSIQPYPVIHGDLKLENVLVGDGLIAKVCALLTTACCSFRITNGMRYKRLTF